MIKEAINRILEIAEPVIYDIDKRSYTDKKLIPIEEPKADSFGVSTLTALVDYIKESVDKESKPEIIQVESPTRVYLFSQFSAVDRKREYYLEASADLPSISYNRFMEAEDFNIMLQSRFIDAEDRASVMAMVGNIREENVSSAGDDGVSQSVVVKKGIQSAEEVLVDNPVMLKPFRTFHEVEQPTSPFVLRLQDGPKAALFEADGGAWRNEAMKNIKEYLDEELGGLGVTVLA